LPVIAQPHCHDGDETGGAHDIDRASASSAAQRRPSRFMASSSSLVTLCMRIRLE
jgi:hypothetical protein